MLRFSLASLADRTTQQEVWVHISNALNALEMQYMLPSKDTHGNVRALIV
jgi:hypothetical protein